ncbi:glycosyltransferase family 4 protein [Citrobacter portucalensis]|uniref:glycosyltransferase family 4 protein n=1 Tax=Citrobacter portucalensis TaxID=1639133 RepID=UPI0040349767
MNIVIGCSSPIDKGSGILTYCKNLIRACANSGHSILFVAPKAINNSWLNDRNIEYVDFSLDENPVNVCKRLLLDIRKFRPDVIINSDNCYVQQLSPLFPCKFIAVGHLANYAIGALLPLNSDYIDEYIAISNDMKFDMVNKYKIPSHKIKVVHNGLVEELTNKKKVTEVSSVSNEGIKVIFGGEYTKRKGADLFIEFAKKLENENVKLFWTVSNLPRKVEDVISKYGVTVTGRLEPKEFESLLRDCDVLVMPSREEGCPMLLLEAMKLGLIPVVSNGTGAMKEVIKHGDNGYVCELKSWSDEAANIILSDLFLIKLDSLKHKAKQLYECSYSNGEFFNSLLDDMNVGANKNPKPETIDIYDWHRRGSGYGLISSIFNRIRYRFGIIRKVGQLNTGEV